MVAKSEKRSMLLICVFIAQICIVNMEEDCPYGTKTPPIPHPDKCEIYFDCFEYPPTKYSLIERRCDDDECCGNHFSEHALACVHPDEALCAPDLKQLKCNNENDRLGHPTNCSRYFYCNNPAAPLRPTVTDCPDNKHFNNVIKECVLKRDARCDPTYCDEKDNPMRPTLLPNRTDCNAFLKCHNGEAVPLLCPKNLYFSIERDRCEFPYTVNCTDGVRPKY